MSLHDFLTRDGAEIEEKCDAIAKVIEAPLSLWSLGFSLGNFDSQSILFDPVSKNVTIDDFSFLRRVYSASQIQKHVGLDLSSFLRTVDIPTSCQAEISYRTFVMKHFIGGSFQSTFSDSGCPKCADVMFQHVKPHSRITTSPEYATLPHQEWHPNINSENTMDVILADLGYAIVYIDSLTHTGSTSSADAEEHLGVNTKEDLDEPLYTGLTRGQDPNGNVYYRASYYIYPDPSVRSARRKIHVSKEEGGQGQDQEEVRNALLRHIEKTKRQHPEYEIDRNAGQPRANLYGPDDVNDDTPLPPSPYVGISIEPNQKRTYRAHFRIGDERVDVTGFGMRGRDIEHVRQMLLNQIGELRQKHPGIDINPDYGRLKSEVEAEKGPFPYQYMHYLMERNPDGSFPEKRPKNKRKVFFSKDLVQAQRECRLQNLIEKCEFSPAPTPFTFPQKCIAFCPMHSIFTNDPTSTFNPLIVEVNAELLGVSMPPALDSSQGAGPSNLEETEFSELASTLHASVPCSLLLTIDQSVLFAAFAVDSCNDMQFKMLRTGCCEQSTLPSLPNEVNYFLQNQHLPEERVQSAPIFSKQSYFYIFFIIFLFLTYFLHNIEHTSEERIPLKAPLIIIEEPRNNF